MRFERGSVKIKHTIKLASEAYLARGLNREGGKPGRVSWRKEQRKRPFMATYSIKPLLLAITLAVVALPGQVLAGSAATTVNAPVEMWDVIAPRADVTSVVSHIDVMPGQGFDAPGTVIPMAIKIPSRTDFKASVQPSEMWGVTSEKAPAKLVGVSHMDIQPGQSFDGPAASASTPGATVPSAKRTPDV